MPRKTKVAVGCWYYKELLKTLKVAQTLPSTIYLCLPVTVDNVRGESQRDPVLSQVHEMVTKGWQSCHVTVLYPFYARRDEITVHSGCLMWGIRVIVPPKLRPQVLVELHQGHLGVVKMSTLARNYIWLQLFKRWIALSTG